MAMSDEPIDLAEFARRKFAAEEQATHERACLRRQELDGMAPELPFDEVWTPEPEAKLVIPGLGVAPGPVHLVTGTWYTGKTLLLGTMGLCVASGRDLFGLYRVQRGPWIHFDHEMGRRHLKRYVQRLRAGLGVEPEELRDRMSLRVLPTLNLRHEKAIDLYTEILAGYAIATIDPLRAAAPGADENKSEFREYLDLLNVVSDRTGCSIMVLHHGGKPTAEPAARRNTGRGTSAIDDAAQSKFVLSAEEKGAPMLVTHEKTRELAKTLDDFYLEIVNGDEFVRLAHRDVEEMGRRTENDRSAKAQAAIRQALSKFAGRFQGSRDDLVRLVGGRRENTTRAISEMVTSNMLRSEGRGDDRQWFLVPFGSQTVPGTE